MSDIVSTTAASPRAFVLRGVSVFALSVAGLATATTAQGQAAPPNLVGVCAGVSLPRSVVTDVLAPVVGGIVTPVQDSVNPIVGVLGAALPLTPPLAIDAAGLLADAAAGQPVTLQVIALDGTIVGPTGQCDAQADSFVLDTPAGLAIGGNRITGLGASGQEAVAGEIGSIALGNLATTAPAATNAVAIGQGASVTAANSVALGAGSIATRGGQTSYVAAGLPGTQTSAGEVSVGAPGAERQITNVAAGTAPSDAATVAQVQALTANAVQYDSTTRDRVTLAGANGTVIAGVAAGTLSATSTEAVNGSQLAATNAAVSNLTTSITNGSVGAVRYSDAASPTVPNGGTPTNDVTLVGGAAGPVGLHNVRGGAIAAGSTDAVNGGQISAIGQQAINAVTYQTDTSGTRTNTVVLSGGDANAAVTVRNVAAGTQAGDAVNLGQLNAGIGGAVGQANAYTDGRIAAIGFDLRRVRRDAFAGTAGALAAAGLPQAYEAGKGMIAIAGGTYMSQSAFAFGFSKAFADGRTVAKLSGTYDSRGRAGASGGVGYQF